MFKKLVLATALILAFASVAFADDGFLTANTYGDPADSSAAYPQKTSQFSMPAVRVEIARSDSSAEFSKNGIVMVIGQPLYIKAFEGFLSAYKFAGDANYNNIVKSDNLFPNYVFSGDACNTGLAEADILDTKGNIVDKLGVQVVNPFVVSDDSYNMTLNMPLYSWILVELNANPTTGYDWLQDSIGSNVNIADSGYMVNNSRNNLAGAPGRKYFLVQAVSVGQTQFKLVYCRPWNNNDVAGRYQLTINVTN